MSDITLRDQLKLVNFRDIRDDQQGMYHNDTKTVRIYTDLSEWFEFGIYDFGSGRDDIVEHIFNKSMLKRTVSTISFIDEVGILEIWLDES